MKSKSLFALINSLTTISVLYCGNAREAVLLNQQAMTLLDRHLQPELWITAARNQLVFLAAIARAPKPVDPGQESPSAD